MNLFTIPKERGSMGIYEKEGEKNKENTQKAENP